MPPRPRRDTLFIVFVCIVYFEVTCVRASVRALRPCVRACVRACAFLCACVRACVRVCMRACVRSCVLACVHACVHVASDKRGSDVWWRGHRARQGVCERFCRVGWLYCRCHFHHTIHQERKRDCRFYSSSCELYPLHKFSDSPLYLLT